MRFARFEHRWADREEWASWCERAPGVTYCHTPQWAEAWAQSGLEAKALIVTSKASAKAGPGASALLPLVAEQRYRGLATSYRSTAEYGYGGLLVRDVPQRQLAGDVWAYIFRVLGDLTVTSCPFTIGVPSPPDSEAQRDVTKAVDLHTVGGDLRVSWSSNHKRSIKRAEKAGIVVARGDTESDWDEYFDVYQDSLRRWADTATSTYAREMFAALARDRVGVHLWLARLDGRAVSGAIMVEAGAHTLYWSGASREDALRLNPAHLVIATAIDDAKQRGQRWFDLGGSGGHEGVDRFKDGFRPVTLQTFTVSRTAPRIRAIDRARRLLPA